MTTMTNGVPKEYEVAAGQTIEQVEEAFVKHLQSLINHAYMNPLPSPPSPAPVTWEDARNAPSQQMYDQKDWDDYMQAYGQACSSGGSCTNSSGGSCGNSCEPKKRIEDLPCTCNDEQFKNHAATGQGYSDTCPYHTEWAKERRRVERGL